MFMEVEHSGKTFFLALWKAKFSELVKIIQDDFAGFFGKKNIGQYYNLNEDAAQQRLVLHFNPVNMLPNIILKRLQKAFVLARPKGVQE